MPPPLGGADGNPLPLDYAAPQGVRDIIASLGRTEDLRLSPGGRRLAIAAALRNRIVLIDLEIARLGAAPRVVLAHAVELSSPWLNYPHGLEFVDDRTLIVASRRGGIAVFDLPPAGSADGAVDLAPVQVLPSTAAAPLQRPGSLALVQADAGRCEILVCNNSGHNITRHVLDRAAGYATLAGEVLLEKRLDIPDGIAVCPDRRWIAVSNHNGHCVMLYENLPGRSPQADPDGLLRGLHAPHGLRFGADGRSLFVADAGAPYVHLYLADARHWRGIQYPAASIGVIDPEAFARGRYNAREGGPKGIDVDGDAGVMVVTSEWQPLAFFDVAPVLVAASADAQGPDAAAPRPIDHDARALRYELDALGPVVDVHRRARMAEIEARRAVAQQQKAARRLAAAKRSASWRVSAPLRWIGAALRRWR